ncbi:MAG: hypothetical protein WCX65_05125 [bacterium]
MTHEPVSSKNESGVARILAALASHRPTVAVEQPAPDAIASTPNASKWEQPPALDTITAKLTPALSEPEPEQRNATASTRTAAIVTALLAKSNSNPPTPSKRGRPVGSGEQIFVGGSCVIHFRAGRADRELIHKAADILDLTTSALIRAAATSAARAILADHEAYEADREKRPWAHPPAAAR